jgi:endonuclease YncB( thermonuclease family)
MSARLRRFLNRPHYSFSRFMVAALLLSVQMFPPATAVALPVQGRCVGVSDGDTVTLLIGGRSEKVRLYGIDAPEKVQPFGERAKLYAASLVFGRQVDLEREGNDRYGRTIGKVYVSGRSLNEEMLRKGLAWHYRAYSHDAGLEAMEQTARRGRLGLWTDPSPVPPWDFRRSVRTGRPAGAGAQRAAPSAMATGLASVGTSYRGNTSSRVFHKRGCRSFDCPNCTTAFPTRQAALAAGYKPCGACRP